VPMDRMVGEAYILMRGDGTLLKRDFQKAGHEAGSAYSEAFDDELSNAEKGTLVRFRRNLAQATAEVDFSKFRREFGSVEKTFDGINRELDEMRRSGSLTVEQVSRVRKELLEWAEAETRAAEEAKRLSDQQKSLIQFFKDQEARLKRLNVAEKRRLAVIAESARAYNSYNRNIEFSAKKAEKAILDQDRAFRSYADNVRFSIERRAEPALLRMGRRIDILGDRFVIYGDRVGRVFGRGSRNNFLNLLGRSIGALVTGPMRLLVETAGKVSTALGTMGKDFNLARLDGLGFGAAMGKALQGGLRAGLPGLAALAAGIAALAVILPTTVALLFTLAGALTAVVGAITLGVLGGLLALVPVLASVVGGFVVLGVAFARAGKEGTRAARAVKSLKDAFRDFGESVADASNDVVEAFAGTAEKLLSQMTPFFVNMAEALTEVAKHFGKVLDDPAVKKFITEFSTVLPRVFENIGIGISNMIAGLLGFFAAILGPVENLSQGFLEMGERFREFATSADGQNKIAGWFDTAWEAAQDLWTILGNVFTILGKIFTAGTEGPGQGFLDYLVEVTEKFDKWLSTPEGKSALEDFFVRVEELMITAKDAIEDFGEALDKLDTDKAAQDAQSFADAMGSLATGLNTVAVWLTYINIGLDTLFTFLTEPYSGAEGLIGGLMSLITVSEPVRNSIQGIITGLDSLKTWFSENFGLADSFAESALVAPFAWAYDQLFGNSWIPDIVNGFSEWIPQIPGIIASALAGVGEALVAPFRDAATNLLGILARLPGQILGFIVGIPGMISGALSRVTSVLPQPFQDGISAVRSRLSGFPGMVSNFVSGIPGVVSSALSGLAGAFSRPFATAYSAVSGWVSAIRTLISGIGASISGAASRVSSLASRARGLTPFASGGVVYGPTRALIGEAGREAVIPLDRPLNMVDPSVRWLSAIAQGKATPAMASGGIAGGAQITIAPGAIVVQSNQDPAQIAQQVMDKMAEQFR
jgi:hypothetical protein